MTVLMGCSGIFSDSCQVRTRPPQSPGSYFESLAAVNQTSESSRLTENIEMNLMLVFVPAGVQHVGHKGDGVDAAGRVHDVDHHTGEG